MTGYGWQLHDQCCNPPFWPSIPGTKVSDEPQIPPVNEVAKLLAGLQEITKYDAG